MKTTNYNHHHHHHHYTTTSTTFATLAITTAHGATCLFPRSETERPVSGGTDRRCRGTYKMYIDAESTRDGSIVYVNMMDDSNLDANLPCRYLLFRLSAWASFYLLFGTRGSSQSRLARLQLSTA